MEIMLTPDLEVALVHHARKQGMTLHTLVLEMLRERFGTPQATETISNEQETLFEFLDGHIGVLHSSEYIPGGGRMSEDGGKKFAAGMAKKRHQGRL